MNVTDEKAQPLSEEECKAAVSDLYKPLPSYRSVNRRFCDPINPYENAFALFSFIKAADESKGIYGVAKIRGSFRTEAEAAARAEEIIRDVDSTNSIFTCRMGEPFPLVVKGHAAELTELDLVNNTEKIISENVRAKRKAEQKEMDEIKRRRDELVKDDGTIKQDEDAEDNYITQRMKLAHLRYCISEHSSKLKECIELVKKVQNNLNECVKINPEYEQNYMKRFKSARREVGIAEEMDTSGFLKYMSDSIDNDVNSYLN